MNLKSLNFSSYKYLIIRIELILVYFRLSITAERLVKALRSCLNVANGGMNVLSKTAESEMHMFFHENKRLLREEMTEIMPTRD